MKTDIEILLSFVPRMLSRRLKKQSAGPAGPSEEVQQAVLLFVDVSGFTALSERLADLGAIGSERLTEYLNTYFTRIIELTAQHGGDVLKLAGDAMLVAWPIENSDAISQHLRAMECALGIQRSCHRYEVAPDEYLSVKIGLATGPLRTLIVGGKLGRWEFLPVCPLVQEVGRAESAAGPGQIVVTAEFREALGEAFDGAPIGEGLWRLTGSGGIPLPDARRTEETGDELTQPLRGFIPGAVLGRLADGSESWLAELRRVSAVFIYVHPGGGSSCSELALEVMQGLTEGIQEAIYRFEGSINKWSVDEKGICLLAVFGLPPLSHEDDPLRAVRAAEEVAAFLEARGESCRIGVASGRVYCGLVGSRVRQEYTIIGFAVNRAARLAQAVSSGILCDLSTKRQCEGHVSFDVRPPIEVKGIKDPLAVFSPVRGVPEWDETGAVTGHVKEMEQLLMGIQHLRRGHTQVYVIEGEAGIGKSTFLHRWGCHAQASGVTVATGGGDSLHRHTPYYAWKLLLTDLFRKLGATTPQETGALIERLLDQENHSRLLAPLLNDILPAGLKDNHVSAQIVGGLRADNTRKLVVALITACAKERPLAVVIEDLHWCDSLSLRLTQAVAEKSVPLLLVAATRPSEADDGMRAFYEGVPAAQVIRLGKFTAPECAALICAKLGALSVERPVTDFIFSRSGGSPLFATELTYALCESRRVYVEGGVCCVVPGVTLQHDEVPDSVQGVITQRVDRLDTPSQVAVKVASVIGEAFPTGVLKAVYPLRQEAEQVDLHLSQLEKCDLIRGQGGVSSMFRFSHALVHDTVYGLILYSHRKTLHSRIALHLEEREETGGKHTAALLGHHWKEGGELRRAAHHLGVAGEHAVREGAYQDALKILNQTLEIGADQFLDGDTDQRLQQGHWHRMKAEALLGLGQLLASAGELVVAADLLGCPVPSTVDANAVVTALRRRTREAGGTEADRGTESDRTRILELVFCYEVLSILNLFSDNRIACLGAAFQTLAHAERLGDGPDLARALATVSLALSVQPERGMADWYAAAALRMADRLGQEFTSSRVLELLGMQYMGAGQWQKAEAAFVKAIDGFTLVGDHRRRIECTCLYSTFQHYRGNFGRRVVMGMEVFSLAEISGDLQAGAWGYLDQLESLIAVGEFKAAQAIAEKLADMIGSSIIGCDVIMTHGLLARLALRRGDSAAAVAAAQRALDVIRESDPTIVYNLEAYAAPAEVFVTMWQRELGKTAPDAAAAETWKTLAAGACDQLRRFARIFRIAAPRYFLWRGLSHHLAGRPGPGRRHLHRSTITARRLEMPYEEALTAMHRSFLLPVENPERVALAARAQELFSSLSAEYQPRLHGGRRMVIVPERALKSASNRTCTTPQHFRKNSGGSLPRS